MCVHAHTCAMARARMRASAPSSAPVARKRGACVCARATTVVFECGELELRESANVCEPAVHAQPIQAQVGAQGSSPGLGAGPGAAHRRGARGPGERQGAVAAAAAGGRKRRAGLCRIRSASSEAEGGAVEPTLRGKIEIEQLSRYFFLPPVPKKERARCTRL